MISGTFVGKTNCSFAVDWTLDKLHYCVLKEILDGKMNSCNPVLKGTGKVDL